MYHEIYDIDIYIYICVLGASQSVILETSSSTPISCIRLSTCMSLRAACLSGRFQEVTLEALLLKGASHFAWLRPKEFAAEGVECPSGGFAYQFQEAEAAYFPVAGKPVISALQEQ